MCASPDRAYASVRHGGLVAIGPKALDDPIKRRRSRVRRWRGGKNLRALRWTVDQGPRRDGSPSAPRAGGSGVVREDAKVALARSVYGSSIHPCWTSA